jgi:hypothetical protein
MDTDKYDTVKGKYKGEMKKIEKKEKFSEI